MDRKELRKIVFMQLLTGWPKGVLLTLLPVSVGAMGAMVGFAFKMDPLVIAASLATMGAGAITFVQRLLNGGPALMQELTDKIARDEKERREAELDQLYEELKTDRDARTGECLENLRVLTETFRNHEQWMDNVSTTTKGEILAGVQPLYEAALRSLKRSFVLYKTAQQLSGPAKKEIERRREGLVRSAQQCVATMTKALADMQQFGTGVDSAQEEAERTRNELEMKLEIGRRVEQQMSAMGRAADEAEYEKFAPKE